MLSPQYLAVLSCCWHYPLCMFCSVQLFSAHWDGDKVSINCVRTWDGDNKLWNPQNNRYICLSNIQIFGLISIYHGWQMQQRFHRCKHKLKPFIMFWIPCPSFDQTGSILNNKDYTSKFLLNILRSICQRSLFHPELS